jgi:hypothetical protein
LNDRATTVSLSPGNREAKAALNGVPPNIFDLLRNGLDISCAADPSRCRILGCDTVRYKSHNATIKQENQPLTQACSALFGHEFARPYRNLCVSIPFSKQ